MSINWFPGHMAVAVEKIKKAMADHDIVIEILDARCPMASSNPLVELLRLARQRPCLKVLNKTDAADPAVTPQWFDRGVGEKTRRCAEDRRRREKTRAAPQRPDQAAAHAGDGRAERRQVDADQRAAQTALGKSRRRAGDHQVTGAL
jgi:ribosome biogenesis GTPase A